MYDVADILARMQNGDSVEDIAAEFTDALNAAQAQYDAKSKEDEKLADFKAVTDASIDFFKKWYPDLAGWDDEMDAATVLKEIEGVIDLFKSMKNIGEVLGASIPVAEEKDAAPVGKTKIDVDTILSNWLNTL